MEWVKAYQIKSTFLCILIGGKVYFNTSIKMKIWLTYQRGRTLGYYFNCKELRYTCRNQYIYNVNKSHVRQSYIGDSFS